MLYVHTQSRDAGQHQYLRRLLMATKCSIRFDTKPNQTTHKTQQQKTIRFHLASDHHQWKRGTPAAFHLFHVTIDDAGPFLFITNTPRSQKLRATRERRTTRPDTSNINRDEPSHQRQSSGALHCRTSLLTITALTKRCLTCGETLIRAKANQSLLTLRRTATQQRTPLETAKLRPTTIGGRIQKKKKNGASTTSTKSLRVRVTHFRLPSLPPPPL